MASNGHHLVTADDFTVLAGFRVNFGF